MINLNKENIKHKISQSNFDDALQDLSDLSKSWDNSLYNEILILKRQYNDIKRLENLGLEDFNEINIQKNKLTDTALKIVDSIDNSIFNNSNFSIIDGISEDFLKANYDSVISKIQNQVERFEQKNSIYAILGQCYFFKGNFYPPFPTQFERKK